MAVGSERQSGSFLEQDSTAVPKFAYRSFCPCGNLVGECLPQTLPCGLRRLSRRSHAAVERRFYHAKTIQHTAPQPGSQNTHDRGRIRRVCRKAFCLQHEPSRVYPASHNRGSHTPIITVSPVNDELLAAVGKLTAEYGRIGGNLNQIARTLNEWHSPYRSLPGRYGRRFPTLLP